MKAILQRVLSASVTVDQVKISEIGKGILVFAAIAPGDTEKDAETMANKILKFKLWDDEEAGTRWKKNVQDIGGEVLCVSQFTLLAKTTKGTKPDFHGACPPEAASKLYHYFLQKVKDGYAEGKVKNGKFQAMMEVGLVNDGPVTIELNVGNDKKGAADKE
ncbi:D-tyrosyl-tRNA(Tyr) deacylase [Ceratocystis fimbriata CBS 114723]|uniref:D-aminoacyl-tRNA deacylase n=1 Tax=Ceratocystis fimbriata CBS 114723 TaxID=1035309 RepID=A0A2C5XK06_9PEZI|nr:D-tyrosyl-tRNA(Tyr) deacylase [Ceratocystis fimbriata CBS 114723]